jgi:hypothetical protein
LLCDVLGEFRFSCWRGFPFLVWRRYQRNLPAKGPHGAFIFLGGIGTMLGGMYLVIQGRNKRKCVPKLAMISRLPLEFDSKLLVPCLHKWFIAHWNTCLLSSTVCLFAL